MSSYVSAGLRRLVAQRAGGLCEYCLIQEEDTFLGCQVEHFRLDGIHIIGVSDIGQATAELLGFNHPDRLLERDALTEAGRYPSDQARRRMKPTAEG